MSDQPREVTVNVGSQIGAQGHAVVVGGVHFGTSADGRPVRNLQEQVEDLREALAAAHRAGEIDTATLAEADAALKEARRHANAKDDVGRGAFLRALRKTKGLVDEVGGLVSAVAAVIAAVGQLP